MAMLAYLKYVPSADNDYQFVTLQTWKGMDLRWLETGVSEGGAHFFSGTYWTKATAEHWEIPLIAVVTYLCMIPALKYVVAKRGPFDVKAFAFWWNAALSLFSICGVAACVPVLINELWTNGLYFTVCAPMSWYASGLGGFFVALFIYSKVAELVDTVLLLLAGKPVIALQWWHHSTVLLYSWHSYSVRVSTGAWFACMNYTVHSIMYGYFAATGTSYRKVVARYAIYITLLQLVQMLMGMFVTVKAVLHQAAGYECHVNKTNSVLGLSMYASYFILFAKLFVDNHYLKPKKGLARGAGQKETRSSQTRKSDTAARDSGEAKKDA